MLVFCQLRNVEPMSEHKLMVHVSETIIPVTFTAFTETISHLFTIFLQLSGVYSFSQQIGQLAFLLYLLFDFWLFFDFFFSDVMRV